MSLADQIIEQGPYVAGDPLPGWFGSLTAAGINELRDELMAARALKELLTAGRWQIEGVVTRTGAASIALYDTRCQGFYPIFDEPVDLAELVQRAAEHAEVCT